MSGVDDPKAPVWRKTSRISIGGQVRPHPDRRRSSALVLGSSNDASCRAEAVVMKLPLVAPPAYPSTTQTLPPSCVAPSSASLQLIIALASLFRVFSTTIAQKLSPRWTPTKSRVLSASIAIFLLLAPRTVGEGRCLLTSAAFSGNLRVTSNYPEESPTYTQQYASVHSGRQHHERDSRISSGNLSH